ncbi:hypothetical protein V8G54_020487 [Vigna mungo]|uniref:Uncharacterized protein n=1 Tax=Vigna mungo TaxID=3915 RepID=A0AAQ3RWR5_VIGMU
MKKEHVVVCDGYLMEELVSEESNHGWRWRCVMFVEVVLGGRSRGVENLAVVMRFFSLNQRILHPHPAKFHTLVRPLPSRGPVSHKENKDSTIATQRTETKNEKFEKLGLVGQFENWAYGPDKAGLRGPKLGLGASVETRLVGQYGNWALRASQCGNWALGPVWKLGFGASVETGLGGPGEIGLWASVETGLRGQASWAYGPVWKLGLWANVETRLRGPGETGLEGQCETGLMRPGETGLGGQGKAGLGGPGETGLWASVKTGLRGPGKTRFGGQCEIGLMRPGEIGLGGRREAGLCEF